MLSWYCNIYIYIRIILHIIIHNKYIIVLHENSSSIMSPCFSIIVLMSNNNGYIISISMRPNHIWPFNIIYDKHVHYISRWFPFSMNIRQMFIELSMRNTSELCINYAINTKFYAFFNGVIWKILLPIINKYDCVMNFLFVLEPYKICYVSK